MATVTGGNNTAAIVPIPKVVLFTSVAVEAKIKWTLGISSEAKKLLKDDLCHMDNQTGRLGSIHSVSDLLRLGSRLLNTVTTDKWTLLLKGPTKKSTSLSSQTLLRLGCLFVFRVKEVASLHLKDARKVEELMCVLASSFDFVFCQLMLHAVNTIPNNQLLLVNLAFLPSSFFWNPSRDFHCQVLTELPDGGVATAKPASSAVEGGGKSLQKKMGKAKPTLGKMSGPVHMLY